MADWDARWMTARLGRHGPLRSTHLSPFALLAGGGSLVVAGASVALTRGLSFDAWGWLLWGREIAEGRRFTTDGYPTWKPLTGLVSVLLVPLGHAAPLFWLVVARAGAMLALVLAYRLAARLAGRAAGALAVLALLVVPQWLFQAGVAGSEPLLTALLLGAVARHADRHDLQGFGLVFLAALLRPESWPLLLASAVLAWRGTPRGRAVIAAGLVAVPVLWFGGDYLGSGDPFRGGQLAKTTKEAVRLRRMWSVPGLGVLDIAWRIIPLPLLLSVPAAVVPALRRRDPIVLALTLGALVWTGEVAVLGQLGYAGVTRFLFPAAAALAVVGSAGLVRLLASPAMAPAARVAAVGAALALALPSVPHARGLGREVQRVRARAKLDHAIDSVVSHVGRRTFLAAPHVAAQGLTITPLAWRLDVPAESLRRPRFPGLALAEAHRRWPAFRRAVRHAGARLRRRTVVSAPPLRLISVERVRARPFVGAPQRVTRPPKRR
jgi:hypothetical protein